MGNIWYKIILLSLAWGCSASCVFASCPDLKNLKLPHTTITESALVTAGDFQAPDGRTYVVPGFCRVQGVAKPNDKSHIKFEVWLPSHNWNMRYYQFGNGGSAGQITYYALADYLRGGNVVAATDDGHTAVPGAPYSWALNEPEKVIDWGYRALKEISGAAQGIIAAYYSQPARYRYFAGCSRGGQQALTAAQRYPDDWDGILAVSPDPYLVPWWFSTMQRGSRWKYHPEGRIPQSMLPVIQQAALKSCTSKAGVIDGIATNPQYCAFDPAVLACTDQSAGDCLSPAQVKTLRDIYDGPTDEETPGITYPGFPATVETGWAGWMPVEGPDDKAIANISLIIAESFYGNVVVSDPQWGEESFRYKDLTETRLAGQSLPDILNANNPDLTRFKKNDGKLMMVFGWADAAIPPASAIKYYNSVKDAMGAGAMPAFLRLFMVPGMGHCVGGAGANAFDQYPGGRASSLKNDANHSVLRALEAWVEDGQAPQKIIAAKYQDDDPEKGVSFTRLLCPYPAQAVPIAKGNVKQASDFICQHP